MSGLLRWLRDLIIIALVVFGVEAYQTRQHLRGPAPETYLRTLEGDFVRMSSLAGTRTLLVVWAPWCGVCKLETGNIQRVAGWLEPSVHVISVAASYRSIEEVRDYIRFQQVEYPVLLADEKFATSFGVNSFPSFFVLDADGSVLSSAQGYTTTLGLWARAKLAGSWR
jgi:thiol-disulfide isomerase/thioredoxin